METGTPEGQEGEISHVPQHHRQIPQAAVAGICLNVRTNTAEEKHNPMTSTLTASIAYPVIEMSSVNCMALPIQEREESDRAVRREGAISG